MKKHSQNFENLKRCVETDIADWSTANKLTELEQREQMQNTIYGIVRAALFVLSSDEYFEFTEFIHDKGFNH